jgi:hypothetical protein
MPRREAGHLARSSPRPIGRAQSKRGEGADLQMELLRGRPRRRGAPRLDARLKGMIASVTAPVQDDTVRAEECGMLGREQRLAASWAAPKPHEARKCSQARICRHRHRFLGAPHKRSV